MPLTKEQEEKLIGDYRYFRIPNVRVEQTRAITPDGTAYAMEEIDIPSFVKEKLEAQRREIVSLHTIRCPLNKYRDDGVHVTYKCLDCGQVCGEEQQTPLCLDPVIRVSKILSLPQLTGKQEEDETKR